MIFEKKELSVEGEAGYPSTDLRSGERNYSREFEYRDRYFNCHTLK